MTVPSNRRPGTPNIINRAYTHATFLADAVANKFKTERPSLVSAGYPPILAVGDPVHPTTIAVTQIAFHMYLENGAFTFSDNSVYRVGKTGLGPFFPGLAAVSQGIPTVWSDAANVLGPAWVYTDGKFKSSDNAPPFFAHVHVHGNLTASVADVELLFTLRDINNTPPDDIVAQRKVYTRAINSPISLNRFFEVDTRGGGLAVFRMLPGVEYGIYVQRVDAGPNVLVTLDQYHQTVRSVGVA